MPNSRLRSPGKSTSAACRTLLGRRGRSLALLLALGCLVPVVENVGSSEPAAAEVATAPAANAGSPVSGSGAEVAAQQAKRPASTPVLAAPTTAQPAPTTAQPAPTVAQPVPTTAQPAPTTAQPAPVTTTQPAPAPTTAQLVTAAPIAASSVATGAGEALSWAPPAGYASYPVTKVTATNTLTTVSGRGGDVLIQLPTDRAVGPITIADCRNAVIIGGSIRALPSAKVGGYDQRAIYVRNCTGTVHIEGVHIDGAVSGAQTDGIAANSPKAVLQIQNVRVDGLRGGSTGNHADVFQPWGGLLEYRIDRLTGSSNFQGLHVFENKGAIGRGTIRNTNIVGTNDAPVDKGGYYLWTDCDDNYPLVLDSVYVAPRPGRPFTQSVWPSVTHKECPAKVANGVATWPMDSSITGGVNEGRPSSGDFVPAGSVGQSYTSPGYR
ncbi:hypothetical protein [Modestobacter sp. VKM Ac-2985]|uniref:hypothetical protein n=1 Tax=Modestobacter sp. VKM Ac-2985 TaxID=3004139 RepID=UPI0022AB9402|nr:hypothetical protein [Modestobacter sp. VKM Ac-2985]MCZ2836034.1 hypothetical protein [Modestobacter sp. VKM Ac-2985]